MKNLTRSCLIATLALVSILFQPTNAQTVTEEWMRQAGITCGGGVSVDVEGQIDIALLRKLRAASGSAEGSYNYSELKEFLEGFQNSEKTSVYKNYITCLLTLVDRQSGVSTQSQNTPALEGPDEADEIAVLQNGQKRSIKIGDSVAINTFSLIFSVGSMNQDLQRIGYRWSNSETGKSVSSEVATGKAVDLDNGCSITPYKINVKNNSASIIVNCR